MGKFDLAIFDMDGTLIDSERLALQSIATAVETTTGLRLDSGELTERFKGRTLDFILADLENVCGRALSTDFPDQLSTVYATLMETELHAVPGAHEAVSSLSSLAVCVASNGEPESITGCLHIAGLLELFGDNLFSARYVERPKPAPDLFLHAADVMGADPARCIVLEDSTVGIVGALAAGMTAVGFAGLDRGSADLLAGYDIQVLTDIRDFPVLALA